MFEKFWLWVDDSNSRTPKVIRRVQRAYWRTVPYDWRPGQIWYRLTCLLWYRYSTVKPRWLGHTWVDRDVLMAHLMFEVLGQFMEKEFDNREFGPEDPKAEAAGKELQSLWAWWQTEWVNPAVKRHDSRELWDRMKRLVDVSPYMWT